MEEEKKAKHPGGRPTLYNAEIAKEICDLISVSDVGIKRLCAANPHIPAWRTIMKWRWDFPEFMQQYEKAKYYQELLGAEVLADLHLEVIESYSFVDEKGATRIDSGIMAAYKMKSDNQKWSASRLAPDVYGDKKFIDIDSNQKHEHRLKDLE